MDWTNKNVNPSKVVQVGDEVEVMVLDVDEERRRISLGIKQCAANPWEAFAAIHKKSDKVSGQIKSITDFGIFIGLDGGIDGLVHLSDISLEHHRRRRRPQLQEGRHAGSRRAGRRSRSASASRSASSSSSRIRSASSWPTTRRAPSSTASVKEVDAKGATIELGDGIEGYVRANDIAKERVEDATQHLKVGDEIEAKFIGMDRKGRITAAVDPRQGRGRAARDDGRGQQGADASSGTTKLGALLREQLGNKSE